MKHRFASAETCIISSYRILSTFKVPSAYSRSKQCSLALYRKGIPNHANTLTVFIQILNDFYCKHLARECTLK